MPKDNSIKSVIVIGSGPIIIGQGAEFDYAGTQACSALKEEGVKVILVNSNPATIMTDENIADKVYIQPLDVESLEYIIEKEKPDGLLATLGGQTGLNLAMELDEKGILKKHSVRLLGTSIKSIEQAEDRESFRSLMKKICEPIPKSKIVSSIEDGLKFADRIGYPLIVRPAYTLGGSGGGIAEDMDELKEILYTGLLNSRINQVLLEQSVAGWKEIEYEVMRDSNDTCIVICNMENIDPVGVHTGDSMVVAPSQTLSDKEYHLLRNASLKIVRALKIEGGCNVQLALNPDSMDYIVIEVNPRVSRSSALASKAAGYPIAKIAAKIALGMHLHEIPNYVTKKTMASFEPSLDYIVTKIPKWPFDKFNYANKELGTQMKATGEVMAIDRNFESSFLKAVASLENEDSGLTKEHLEKTDLAELEKLLHVCDTQRIFVIIEALRKGMDVDSIYGITKIDKWFLYKFKNLIDIEIELSTCDLNLDLLKKAIKYGFTNEEISKLSNTGLDRINAMKHAHDIYPVYKMVDTCSGEFESSTPYYYSSYEEEDENVKGQKEKIIVIGSGPIRIGQGIEFDYCCVHAADSIRKNGYESIMINNNPETVSTDFDSADKLYFEPLFLDDVYNVIKAEEPKGVIVQFGGQTSINLAPKLHKMGVQILGTPVESIDMAEDRKKFEYLLGELEIPQPDGIAVTSRQESIEASEKLGFPILIRPSYVIGGRSMEVIYEAEGLYKYIDSIDFENLEHPILMDEYIRGTEAEVDAISDGVGVFIPGIMEHIEKTGVHSGDSISSYPPQTLSDQVQKTMTKYTEKIAKALKVKGLINIQFVVKDEKVYIIEVNPRASRTVPILSKVTKVPMVDIAMKVILGKKLDEIGCGYGLMKENGLVAVKSPVFSFAKLKDVDVALTPEMKSTGEVLGVDSQYPKALLKAFRASGYEFFKNGSVYVSLNERDIKESVPAINKLKKLGFRVIAGNKTTKGLIDNKTVVGTIDKDHMDLINKKIKDGEIKMVINTPTKGKDPNRTGFKIRSICSSYNVPCFTSIDTANAYITALEANMKGGIDTYDTIGEYI